MSSRLTKQVRDLAAAVPEDKPPKIIKVFRDVPGEVVPLVMLDQYEPIPGTRCRQAVIRHLLHDDDLSEAQEYRDVDPRDI